MGLPRATDHVSQGGAKMAACTRLDLICCDQKWMVLMFRMSLCVLVESLERSTEMGMRWMFGWVLSCVRKLWMSPGLRLPEKK